MKIYVQLFVSIVLLSIACEPQVPKLKKNTSSAPIYLQVLGIAQDAGFPQINCQKSCCRPLWSAPSARKMVSCLGLIHSLEAKAWMFDATPDFKDQHHQLLQGQTEASLSLAGIFLSHAHMGHYTGLMHLGREAMGAKAVPVYTMPRMQSYLKNNGPWSQLVDLKNIDLHPLKADSVIALNKELTVNPLVVPHRDEFSETIGFLMQSPSKKALFIPDIDKWHLWDRDIVQLIQEVDYAFLDGTFFENGEIPGRDMSEIPHPFIEESMQLFASLSSEDKAKVHFIHFNHTNPILQANSKARKLVKEKGFRIAEEGMQFPMD